MAVGSGAPPVNSEKLELGWTPDAVPSENVVVRLEVPADDSDGEGTVAEKVPVPAVLLSRALVSSEVACEDEDEAEASADDARADEEEGGAMDVDEGADTVEDEVGPAEESAALLEGGATLDDGITELLGAGLLNAGDWLEGWLEGGCEDSLEDSSRVALLGS